MSAVVAWDTEDSDVIIQGTHDPVEAKAAYTKYLQEVGFKPGDEEYSEQADSLSFYEGMKKLWTGPPPEGIGGDEDYLLDQFTEPGEDRTPYLVGAL